MSSKRRKDVGGAASAAALTPVVVEDDEVDEDGSAEESLAEEPVVAVKVRVSPVELCGGSWGGRREAGGQKPCGHAYNHGRPREGQHAIGPCSPRPWRRSGTPRHGRATQREA